MPDIPADAQRSEDGVYWWDGSQWQLVDDQSQNGGQSQADQSQGGADGQDETVALTDDHFANMLAAAEEDVREG